MATRTTSAPRTLPRKVGYWAVAVAAAYVTLLLCCDIGATEGKRVYNTDPPPRTDSQTFLGVRDTTWFPIMYGVSAVVLGSVLWWLVRHWRATGRVHPAAHVLLAFAILSLFDPIISWASYTVFNPELIHFPVDWWWWNMAPTVETSWVTGAYSLFYLSPILAGFWLWNTHVAPRVRSESFAARHPLLAIWLFGSALGFVYDIPTELLLIHLNIWHYWQWWGPAIEIGDAALPVTEMLWTGLLVGTGILLLQPDDKGRSQFAATVVERLRRRRIRLGQTGAVVLLLAAVYAGYVASFSAIRLLDLAHNVQDEWPYPTAKVYDPYDDAEDAGIPGPYSEGVAAWTIR